MRSSKAVHEIDAQCLYHVTLRGLANKYRSAAAHHMARITSEYMVHEEHMSLSQLPTGTLLSSSTQPTTQWAAAVSRPKCSRAPSPHLQTVQWSAVSTAYDMQTSCGHGS